MRIATATPPAPSAGTIEWTWRATARPASSRAPAAGATSMMITAAIAKRMGRLTLPSRRQWDTWGAENIAPFDIGTPQPTDSRGILVCAAFGAYRTLFEIALHRLRPAGVGTELDLKRALWEWSIYSHLADRG